MSAATAPLLEGTQRPRIFSAPDAASYRLADASLDFIGSCFISLDPWQRLAVRTALAEAADGRWAAFEFALFVARQNGKGEVIMALELAKLFLLRFGRPPLILHSAHLFPTAQEAFLRIRGVIDGVDQLRREVKRVHGGHGEEGIELRDGARLRFMARTVSGAGRGFSPTDLFLDEVFRLPVAAMAANLPALSAQRNPQICYFASAGYPDSEVQWSLVQRGRTGDDPSLAYMEYSPAPGAGLDDVQAWLDTNPGIGYRPGLTLETIARERRTLPEEEFGRERMSKWADTGLARVISAAAWAARAGAISAPTGPVAFAVSASWPNADYGCIAVAGRLNGEMVVQIVDRRRGTSWLPERVRELQERHRPVATVLDDKDPCAREKAALEKAGVTLTGVNLTEAGQAAGMFLAAVCGDKPYLRHFDQPELNEAVAGATKRTVGDAWTWARQGQVDISPLVGCTLAAWAVTANEAKPFFASWR